MQVFVGIDENIFPVHLVGGGVCGNAKLTMWWGCG
jgi:hypothetical protein